MDKVLVKTRAAIGDTPDLQTQAQVPSSGPKLKSLGWEPLRFRREIWLLVYG
jgi:hypothetical protein